MSNTRGDSPGEQRQELVFCHECENEWYKTGPGLTCPACRSDFTEIIEQDFDPRASTGTENPLHSHNPWESAEDPDEDDIEQFGPDSFGQSRTMPGSFQTSNRSGNANVFQHPLMGDVSSIFQSITGIQGFPANFPFQGPTGHNNHNRTQSQGRTRSTGSNTTFTQTQAGPNFSVTWSTTRPGIHFSTSTTTGSPFGTGRTPGREGVPMPDMNEIISGIFGNIGGVGNPDRRAGPGAQSPFSAMLASMLDPINASHGDAVFSQEALDRVISQLMEQNPGGRAPGPAAASAIRGLPKKKLTPDMLDENTGQADCAICMDSVPVGEEVTMLPCSHWFHFVCVEAWLKEHDTCPVCRRGITAKEGSRDTARSLSQAPLHDEGPSNAARRQSGTRDNPFVVDESPSRERRRRPSSRSRRYSSTEEGGSGGASHGISNRVRNFFSGSGGGSTSGGRRSSSGGQR